ncbi:hypothetical protein [Sporosarcina sp. FSL W7-1283]|uniref:hypothetical protein n=1 Tax=Sporosarcina sp. FSL W7-1283 TaxID=2921560 RepID=UPI0030FAA760
MNNNKTLYFERAGMDFYSNEQTDQSDVGNFRIRTSFFDNDGVQHYVEVSNGHRPKKNNKSKDEYYLSVQHFFDVGEQLDNPNRKVCKEFDDHYLRTLDYTKENIIKLINDNLNCNFESMVVLDRFYDYHVHDGKGLYNAMEFIELNHERAKARKKAYDKTVEKYKAIFNRKYPAISIKEMSDTYMILDNHQGKDLLEKLNLVSRYEKIQIDY